MTIQWRSTSEVVTWEKLQQLAEVAWVVGVFTGAIAQGVVSIAKANWEKIKGWFDLRDN